MQNQVAITGLALASTFGHGLPRLANAINQKRRGMHFAHRFQEWIVAPLAELPIAELGLTEPRPAHSDALMRQLSLQLIDELNQETGVFKRYQAKNIGLFIGTTTSGIDGFFSSLTTLESTKKPLLSPPMQQTWIGEQIRRNFPIAGPCLTFSSSCAAAAQALAQAFDCVRAGIIPAAIVGGIDLLNLVTIHGFECLQILDHDYCEPFSPHRKGINLGEGAAFFVLEAQANGPILASLRGYGAVTEAFNMTLPSPGGPWMRLAMEKALESAGILASDISYINAHGTGTIPNDAAESSAMEAIFSPQSVIEATKRYTGHTLGATGALELAICMAKLEECKYSARAQGIFLNPAFALSNSFGFGGSNLSLVISGGEP